MITFTVNIADSAGQSVRIARDYSGQLTGRTLSEIESLIFEAKKETMQACELSLLELNQASNTKKK